MPTMYKSMFRAGRGLAIPLMMDEDRSGKVVRIVLNLFHFYFIFCLLLLSKCDSPENIGIYCTFNI